jgi:hypothetical protein
MLGDTGMLRGSQGKLPRMGISCWTSLLVYKRNNLSWPNSRQLAKEDENMPTMQTVQKHGFSLKFKLAITTCTYLAIIRTFQKIAIGRTNLKLKLKKEISI